MSDEQRWDTLGSTGSPAAFTPHLDVLAERATSFDGCYTPFPLCCPSRTSLWTGRMPRHHHVLGNWRAIDPSLAATSIGGAFADAGYHTIYTGKWHVPGTTPARMGFVDCSAIPAVLDGRDRGRYIEAYREYATGQGHELLEGQIENLTANDVASLADRTAPHRATASIPVEHYLETWQTGQFLSALDRRPDDQPWFGVCSYNAPHFPMVVPAPYDTVVDRDRIRLPGSFRSGPETLPREVRESGFATKFADLDEAGWVDVIAHYLGFCALVDAQVGTVLDHLRAAGELDNTIVVYTSDHGDMMGAHRLIEKGHLLHYEETTKVPLLISHPDAGAARSQNLVSVVDVAATLAEFAGLDWTGHDGRSFASAVGDPVAAPTRGHVTAETVLYGMESEANGGHVDPHSWNADTDALNLSVRAPGFRYIYRSRDEDELYDHVNDPDELRNVAGDPAYAVRRAALAALLADEVADTYTPPGIRKWEDAP